MASFRPSTHEHREIFTIGHSNHAAETLVSLLRQQGVELVVDVRSSPYSRFVPQANREALAVTLQAAAIGYCWLGDRLGGKPGGATADYAELRASSAFSSGIDELVSLSGRRVVAILCAEGDYRVCHRHKLIAPALVERGVRVLHIEPDGTAVDEEAEPRQLALF